MQQLISVVTTKIKDNVFTGCILCVVFPLMFPNSHVLTQFSQVCYFIDTAAHTKHEYCVQLYCQLYRSLFVSLCDVEALKLHLHLPSSSIALSNASDEVDIDAKISFISASTHCRKKRKSYGMSQLDRSYEPT